MSKPGAVPPQWRAHAHARSEMENAYLEHNGWRDAVTEQFIQLCPDFHDSFWTLFLDDHVRHMIAVGLPIRLCGSQ